MRWSITLNLSKLILPDIFLKQHCLTLSYFVSKNEMRWDKTEGKITNSITSQILLFPSRSRLSKPSCWWHHSQHCCFLQTLVELTVLRLPWNFIPHHFLLGMSKTILLIMKKKKHHIWIKCFKNISSIWNFF